MRRLNSTVVAGGVVYPAGTSRTDDLERLVTNPALWDDDETKPADAESTEQAVIEHNDDATNAREATLTAEVERLTAEVETLTAENASLREQLESAAHEGDDQISDDEGAGGEPDPSSGDEPAPAEDYSEYGVKELKAELKLRNQGRETPIDVAEPGNKPELIDALVADDQARV